MITLSEITEAGHFNKPHGIKGEISVSLDFDFELTEVKCIVIAIDGIFVPFFIKTVRAKTADTYLITLDGIDSDTEAQTFTNRPFYILRSDIPDDDNGDNEDGFYASDLIGFQMTDINLGKIGIITDINDSTQNVLFIVSASDGKEIYVPVVDEFIISIDDETKTVTTELPEDIITLNG